MIFFIFKETSFIPKAFYSTGVVGLKMCKEPFESKLAVCVNLYRKLRFNRVDSTHRTLRDVHEINKNCEKRRMTFRRINNSSTVPESQINITLDIEMFTCPITKMDFKYSNGSMDLELEDFYLTEGMHSLTFGVLRNSTSSDNICLTNIFKFKFSKEAMMDILKNVNKTASKN